MSLIKKLTPENENNTNIFNLIQNLFYILENNNWLKMYINWELELLKFVGYDLNLKDMVHKENINNKTVYYVKSSTQKKIVPSFLINNDIENIDHVELLKGITIVTNFMEKNIFTPNNMKIPYQRKLFENSLIN